jgi:quercetin dioxygenase-like cupin family protein
MEENEPQRLRQHPEERFAGPQHRYDLMAAANHLRAEIGGSGVAGHRQESLYKHGPTSVSLFLFGPQTRLAPHRTKGTVVIHVLKGNMIISAEGQSHDLRSGNVLVLAAGVQHEVVSQEESEMLLTVHLDPKPASA